MLAFCILLESASNQWNKRRTHSNTLWTASCLRITYSVVLQYVVRQHGFPIYPSVEVLPFRGIKKAPTAAEIYKQAKSFNQQTSDSVNSHKCYTDIYKVGKHATVNKSILQRFIGCLFIYKYRGNMFPPLLLLLSFLFFFFLLTWRPEIFFYLEIFCSLCRWQPEWVICSYRIN